MNRLVLPTVHASRSAQLVLFEHEFENLNAFYWTHQAATALMYQQAAGHERVSDFIPADQAQRLNISRDEMTAMAPRVQQTVRYSMLIQVVTYYEVYLADFLFELVKSLWPLKNQISVKIRPTDLPAANLDLYLQRVTIESLIKSIIDENYSIREKRINKLLTENNFEPPADSPGRTSLVVAACEIRNCIVHAGGIVDDRALNALNSLIPGLRIGDLLKLEESLMWQLLGAIRDSARALDYVVRKPRAAKIARKAAKKQRYNARRKARNLELKKIFGKG